MNCIFCGTKRFKKIAPRLRDSNTHSVVECKHCHLVQLTPVPSIDADQKFYDERLQAKNIGLSLKISELRRKQEPDVKRRADWVIKNCSPGSKVLDIGCGYGFFVEEMRKRKFHPTGIEISETAREIAKNVTKAKILNINLLKASFNQKYDAITMFHVMEHISEPVKFLNQVRNLLKTNGKLFIEVPNLDDLMLKSNPAYRDFCWQRAHVSYFNPKTLAAILQKSGYQYKFHFVQRYGLENLMNWVVTGKPQLNQPSFSAEGDYHWLEKIYKQGLVKNHISDTIIAIAKL